MLLRRHRLAMVTFLVSTMAVVASLLAQDRTGTATFSTSTNLVIVDVYAYDKSGCPVMNLNKEDFTILEDGKPTGVLSGRGETVTPLSAGVPTLLQQLAHGRPGRPQP